MSDQQQTISIPSVLILGVLGFFAVRYFFFSSASSSRSTNSRTANPQDVEQVASMFPQVPRRNIIWDLQQSGGSVAATTERILSRGTLDNPPPTFQPPILASSTPSTADTAPNQSPREHIDLIQRYNLGDKVTAISASASADDSGTGATQTQSWSNNKAERHALLRRRREEMILNARRKMEEKERQRATGEE